MCRHEVEITILFMINLSLVQRPNPKDLEAARKFYVSTKSAGEITLDQMSELISEKCTLTETDVLAVLSALTREMSTHLMDGKIIRFGNFGSFQLSLSSAGVETAAEASRTQVKGARVRFRPGARIQAGLKQLKYSLTTT
jgi:predicted histone-like DNA-binding protein